MWRLIEHGNFPFLQQRITTIHGMLPWLQEKIQDLIDCINLVDVSVVPDLARHEIWTLCSKAVCKGEKFYLNASENPSLLNDLLMEPCPLLIPDPQAIKNTCKFNVFRMLFQEITNRNTL